ncbi:hypothetical protein B0H14DRAFT_3132683 [Mycena olivaceomarginata]|nr:hypothetical protein B0H14DRAFT_3132683 [Mycena olivaceomarginata]
MYSAIEDGSPNTTDGACGVVPNFVTSLLRLGMRKFNPVLCYHHRHPAAGASQLRARPYCGTVLDETIPGPHPPESPMALFDKGDWVSQGKIWRDIPPHVKRVCDQDFVIPAAMASKILPQDGLSVTGFLDFTVPLPATTIENPDVSMFFIVQSVKVPAPHGGEHMWVQ